MHFENASLHVYYMLAAAGQSTLPSVNLADNRLALL